MVIVSSAAAKSAKKNDEKSERIVQLEKVNEYIDKSMNNTVGG